MKMVAISQELSSTSYPGRGIIIGRSADGSKAVTAYFIMGRSVKRCVRISRAIIIKDARRILHSEKK